MYERDEDRGGEDGPRPGQNQNPDGEAAAADQLEEKRSSKNKGRPEARQGQTRVSRGAPTNQLSTISKPVSTAATEQESEAQLGGFFVPSSGELFHRRTSWPSGFNRWQMRVP